MTGGCVKNGWALNSTQLSKVNQRTNSKNKQYDGETRSELTRQAVSEKQWQAKSKNKNKKKRTWRIEYTNTHTHIPVSKYQL